MKLENEDLNTERAKIGLRLLLESEDDLEFANIRITNPKALNIRNFKNEKPEIIVLSNWQIENISESSAKIELEQAKALVEKLCSLWPELSEFIGSICTSLYLHHNYGNGETRSFELKKNGELVNLLTK